LRKDKELAVAIEKFAKKEEFLSLLLIK